jgi:ATP-dependent RNA helicase HelY
MGIDTVGRLTIPGKFNAQDARARKELGVRAVGEARLARDRERTQRHPRESQVEVDAVRAALRRHPCHSCPDREDHARWAERYFRTLRDKDRIASEIQRATGSIAAVFDRRCAVLRECGYLSGEGEETVVTAAGITLKTLYAENDIVMAECLRDDVWARLSPAGLAAAVSTLLYSQGRRRLHSPYSRWAAGCAC